MWTVRREQIAATTQVPRPERRNYYEILGVGHNASGREIKVAFRKLARRYDPDRNPLAQASDRFREISEAYAVLSDPAKRESYDSSPAVAAPQETAIAVREQSALDGSPAQELRLARPAAFWPRVGAFSIDFVLTLAFWFALSYYSARLHMPPITALVLLPIASFIYFVAWWTTLGQTPAMMLLRLRVVGANDGPVNLDQAVKRVAVHLSVFMLFGFLGPVLFVFLFPFVIGIAYSTISFDVQRRPWHDRMANTRVIKVDRK